MVAPYNGYYWGEDVNMIYPNLIEQLGRNGKRFGPRGTQTLELHPVIFDIEDPRRRIVSSRGRPINLAFALAEVLHIIGGRQDVEMLKFYNSSIDRWSDDGQIFNASYGYRLRHAHGYDQLRDVASTLSSDLDSRRAVLTIWHPDDSYWNYSNGEPYQERITRDRACNVLALPLVRGGELDWTQVVRSNDVILGVPYNFIQWTSVQEYLASQLNLDVGRFHYLSNSMHAYLDTYYDFTKLQEDIKYFDIYDELDWGHPKMEFENHKTLLDIELAVRESNYFPSHLGAYWKNVFDVLRAHRFFKEGKLEEVLAVLLGGDKVFAATQIKFYWGIRWRHIRSTLLDKAIEKNFPHRVVEWIKESVRTPASSLGEQST